MKTHPIVWCGQNIKKLAERDDAVQFSNGHKLLAATSVDKCQHLHHELVKQPPQLLNHALKQKHTRSPQWCFIYQGQTLKHKLLVRSCDSCYLFNLIQVHLNFCPKEVLQLNLKVISFMCLCTNIEVCETRVNQYTFLKPAATTIVLA